MQRKAASKLLRSLIIAGLCVLALQNAVGTTVSLEPAQTQLPSAGGAAEFHIQIDDIEDLFGWQIEIAFSSSVLQFDRFIEGEFLKRGGATFAVQPVLRDIPIDPEEYDRAALVAVTAIDSGVSGGGRLGTVRFIVQAEQSASVKLQNPKFLDSSADTVQVETGEASELLPNQPPTAVIQTETKIEAGAALQLDGSLSTDDEGIVLYVWSFGDGGSAAGAQTEHAYARAGEYIVLLTVVDERGAMDRTSVAVQVFDPADRAVRAAEGAYIVFHFNLPAAEADAWAHIKIWEGSLIIPDGAFLEYQVRISGNSPAYRAAVDIAAEGGKTLSGSGAKDENGASADPGEDLSDHAVDQWYHRKIPLQTLSGAAAAEISLAFQVGPHGGGAYRAFFDNIQITDGDWVLETIYANEENFPLNEPARSSALEGAGGIEGVLHAGAAAGEIAAHIQTGVQPGGKLAAVWANLKADSSNSLR